jgi:hypothetical protein
MRVLPESPQSTRRPWQPARQPVDFSDDVFAGFRPVVRPIEGEELLCFSSRIEQSVFVQPSEMRLKKRPLRIGSMPTWETHAVAQSGKVIATEPRRLKTK